jgi:opacity protein-like surface antigen
MTIKTAPRLPRLALISALAGTIIFVPLTGRAISPGPADSDRLGLRADWRHVSAELNSGAVFVTEKGFGHGLRYGAGVLLGTGRRSGLEILFETFSVPMKEGAAGFGAGKMDMRSLLINGHLFFPNRSPILPYTIVGVGFTFLGYLPDIPVHVEERDFVDRFALQLGGGLDFRISSRLAMTGKIRYNMVKTWVEELPRTAPIRETDPRTQEIYHLYGLNLSLGLKYFF